MTKPILSSKDKAIILQCMRCIHQGSFISDAAFHPRVGLERRELLELIEAWPNIDDSAPESDAQRGVNNALNEVSHGISFSSSDWNQWFDVSRDEVREVYRRWAFSVGKKWRGIM